MATTKTRPTADTRPLLHQARATIPGLAELDATIPRVRAAIAAAVQQQPATEADIMATAVDQLLAGDDDATDNLGARIVDAQDRRRRWEAQTNALEQVRPRLVGRRNSLIASGTDHGLRFLAERLADLIDQARPVAAALGDVTTAEKAITAGVAAQWSTARALAARHQDLRAAQLALVQNNLDAAMDEFGTRLGNSATEHADPVNS